MSKLQDNESVRLDKWLWAARFYKTRGLARDMISGGKVHYNGQRTKASKHVELGALVTLRQSHDQKEVVVDKLSGQRRGAPEAQTLYTETEQSIEKRAKNAQARELSAQFAPHPDKKPDKKQRRELLRTKSRQVDY